MTTDRLRFAALLAPLLSAAASAPAQELSTLQRSTAFAAALEEAACEAVPGGLVATTGTYQARFGPAGVTFVPALGERAPVEAFVSLQLASVLRGEGVAPEEAGALAASPPLLRDGIVRYQRGPLLEEFYELRPDGIEQSFRIGEMPEGRGDLRVVLRLASNLRPTTGTRRSELLLEGDHGGVHIGKVLGIDAAGAEQEGWMNCDGEFLELVLPAEFVEAASYPLVVDPLLGSRFLAGTTSHDSAPALAYEQTNDVYLLAWEVVLSASNSEIFARGIRPDGSVLGTTAFTATGRQRRPRVASIGASHRFLLVWEDDRNGNWDVLARTIDADFGSISPAIVVAGSALDETRPDAAGDRNSIEATALVAWTEASTVGAVVVAGIDTSAATPVVASSRVVDAVGPLERDVSLSACLGDDGTAVLAYRRDDPQTLGVRVLRRDLSDAASGTRGMNKTIRDFDVDGYYGICLLAVQLLESNGVDSDIAIQGFQDTTSGGFVSWANTRTIAGTADRDEFAPAVAYCGNRFAVAWISESATSAAESAGRLAFFCSTIHAPACSPVYEVGNQSGIQAADPALATKWSGGVSGEGQGLVVLQEIWPSTAVGTQLRGQRFQDMVGGSIVDLGGGCQGGTQTTSGPAALGNADFRFVLDSAPPPSGFTYLLIAAGAGNVVPLCPSCDLVVTTLAIPRIPISTGATFAAPIPLDGSLVGGTLESQFLRPTGSLSLCGIPGIASSNILRIVLDF